MSNETRFPLYPESQRDVALLKQTAMDAVSDLGSTAAVHASKAKGQLKDLTGHLKEESSEHLALTKNKVSDFVDCARDFAMARPLECIGAALVVGFLIGLSRRTRRKD